MAQSQLQIPPQESMRAISQVKISSEKSSKTQRRGILWVIGSFAFCPCHLPLTLGLLAAVFGGTALGTFVLRYSFLAGAIITIVWLAGTWYGFRQLRARQTCAIR